jgi:hypothetical protein
VRLTEAKKEYIDGLSIYALLNKIRFAPLGDSWMQDETGDYWMKRMAELRSADNDAYVQASKDLGWERR